MSGDDAAVHGPTRRAALLDLAGDFVDAVPLTDPLPGSIIHLGRVFCLDLDECRTLEARLGPRVLGVLVYELPLVIYREEVL